MRKIEKYFDNLGLSILKLFILDQRYPVDKIEHEKIKNILVIIRHQMGDMLCATPMIRSLRKFYQDSHITLVTKNSTGFEQVFKHNSKELADEIKSYEYGFENFIVLIKELKERNYDLSVIPSTVAFSATNHLIAYYSRAKIRAGVSSFNGYDNKVDYLLNVRSDFLWQAPRVHQIERNLDVIRQLDLEPKEKHVRINISKEDSEFADEFIRKYLSGSSSMVGFHPGAAKKGNVWDAGKYAELAYMIHQKYNSEIFISEGPEDAVYVHEMMKVLKEKFGLENITKHRGKLMNNM